MHRGSWQRMFELTNVGKRDEAYSNRSVQCSVKFRVGHGEKHCNCLHKHVQEGLFTVVPRRDVLGDLG